MCRSVWLSFPNQPILKNKNLVFLNKLKTKNEKPSVATLNLDTITQQS